MAEEEQVYDLTNQEVITKYKTACDIANKALTTVIEAVAEGKTALELCDLGDNTAKEGAASVYNKGSIEKGLAFPTCISVNHCCGHYSPLPNEDKVVLKNGDVVKIDLGVHVDGLLGLVGQTVVVGATADAPVEGRAADVIVAAHTAAEAAMRLMKPGHKNTEVTEVFDKVVSAFNCNMVEGVLSHQVKRFVIDGNNVIISKTTPEQKVDEFEFEANHVYCLDVIVSTGQGKAREEGDRCTVFKRDVQNNYQLKMKAAREFFGAVNQKFPTFPFTLREFLDKNCRLGIVECMEHELFNQYPVLYEKEGEIVAQFKYTLLVLPGGTQKATGVDMVPLCKSDKTCEDEQVKELLAISMEKKKKKRSNKKKAKADDN